MAAIKPETWAFLQEHWQTVLSLTLMVIAILVGIPLIFRLKREVAEEREPITDRDVLAELKQAHAAGEIDDAEWQRVRALLARPQDPAAPTHRPPSPRRDSASAPDEGDDIPPPPDAP